MKTPAESLQKHLRRVRGKVLPKYQGVRDLFDCTAALDLIHKCLEYGERAAASGNEELMITAKEKLKALR
jgi:hypothetical protein